MIHSYSVEEMQEAMRQVKALHPGQKCVYMLSRQAIQVLDYEGIARLTYWPSIEAGQLKVGR